MTGKDPRTKKGNLAKKIKTTAKQKMSGVLSLASQSSLVLSRSDKGTRLAKQGTSNKMKGRAKKVKSLRKPTLSLIKKTFNTRIRKKFLTVFVQKLNEAKL